MREVIKKAFYWIIPIVGAIFFDKKYLVGKHFVYFGEGWWWVCRAIWFQKILGFNRRIPFPISYSFKISNYQNLIFGKNNLNNFQSPGVYFQNFAGKIILGDDVYIAPNVGIITANHDLNDLSKHIEGKNVTIGDRCWIGMNAVILPGVTLGSNTIVGAGTIVTKSFVQGNVVIAGNPARIIKEI